MAQLVLATVLAPAAASCADPPDRPTARPPDRPNEHFNNDVVVHISSTGDPWGAEDAGFFQMQQDGTVYLSVDGVFAIDTYQLSQEGVDGVRQAFGEVPFDEDIYGHVNVTDQGTTSVYANLDGDPRSVSIYGLRGGERDGLARRVGGPQAMARIALLDLLDEIEQLSAEAATGTDDPRVAEAREPYVPERFLVTVLPNVSGSRELLTEAHGPALPWPLAAPLTDLPLHLTPRGDLCTTLTGDDAATLADAMQSMGDDGRITRDTLLGLRAWRTGAERGDEVPVTVGLSILGLTPGDDRSCLQQNQAEDLAVEWVSTGWRSAVTLPDPTDWSGRQEADHFETATPLSVYTATPLLTQAVSGSGAGRMDLSSYDYEAIIAEVDGVRHLDVEATRRSHRNNHRDEPETWRARTDLAALDVTDLEFD